MTDDATAKLTCFDRREYSKKYYAQNKERILQYQKDYYRKKRKPKPKAKFEVRHGSFWLFGDNFAKPEDQKPT